MNTSESLKNDLKAMGLEPCDAVLIHSSMKKIGPTEGGADGVLDALCGFFSEGLVVLPTLTWSVADSAERIFDISKTPSQVGILTELFRRRKGVLRSLHPTHSLAALGRDAAWLVSGDCLSHTPCGPASSWHKLLEINAKILMIGCDLTSCTFIHGIEEWNGVPGRLAPPAEFTVIDAEGRRRRFLSSPHLGSPSEQYWRAQDALSAGGVLTFGRFGGAQVMLMQAQGLFDTVSQLLSDNPALFDKP